MPTLEKAEKEALKFLVKTLTLQEVRVLQLERTHGPSFLLDEMARSIQEAKRQVIGLLRHMPSKTRRAMIKKVILESIDEEIDYTIMVRKNRCLRCLYVRFIDKEGSFHENLPARAGRVQWIGCEVTPLSAKMECTRFSESPTATSIDDYIGGMAFFYEVKEMFDQFDTIWEDYFLNK